MLPLPFPAASITLGYGGVDGDYYTASSPHLGIDFSSWSRGIVAGCVFRASGVGRVVRSGVGPVGVTPSMARPNSLAGNSIDVDYGNVITRYMHRPADSPSPAVGAAVVEGSVLGVIGNTGLSGGAHLHMETWDKSTGRRVNPARFFDFTRTVTTRTVTTGSAAGSSAGSRATPFPNPQSTPKRKKKTVIHAAFRDPNGTVAVQYRPSGKLTLMQDNVVWRGIVAAQGVEAASITTAELKKLREFYGEEPWATADTMPDVELTAILKTAAT